MTDVEGLTKVYVRSRKDGARALDGVSFDVPDQSIFGFLGAKGVVKTTTIRILATILPPTEAWAAVGGNVIQTRGTEVTRSAGR